MQCFHLLEGRAYELGPGVKPTDTNGFYWLDCTPADALLWPAAVREYTGVEILDAHLTDVLNKQHPSYFDSTSRYEMIVFRGLAMFPGSLESENQRLQIKTRPSTFFLLPRFLVSIHAADSRTFTRARDRLLNYEESGTRTPKRPEELILRLLNDMVDRYLDLREPLTHRLEGAQRDLLDPRKPFRDWYTLLESRVELRKLESMCEEQHDALQEWRDERLNREHSVCGGPSLTDDVQVRANDVIEHITRTKRHAERLESAIESAVQLHFSYMAHRTNEIMRVLTVLTAIFMPLTLITGIFGMNFESIPGLHNRNGFWIAMGAMALVAGSMLLWFRSRRWVASRGTALPESARYVNRNSDSDSEEQLLQTIPNPNARL
jgi:magnesium transporter